MVFDTIFKARKGDFQVELTLSNENSKEKLTIMLIRMTTAERYHLQITQKYLHQQQELSSLFFVTTMSQLFSILSQDLEDLVISSDGIISFQMSRSKRSRIITKIYHLRTFKITSQDLDRAFLEIESLKRQLSKIVEKNQHMNRLKEENEQLKCRMDAYQIQRLDIYKQLEEIREATKNNSQIENLKTMIESEKLIQRQIIQRQQSKWNQRLKEQRKDLMIEINENRAQFISSISKIKEQCQQKIEKLQQQLQILKKIPQKSQLRVNSEEDVMQLRSNLEEGEMKLRLCSEQGNSSFDISQQFEKKRVKKKRLQRIFKYYPLEELQIHPKIQHKRNFEIIQQYQSALLRHIRERNYFDESLEFICFSQPIEDGGITTFRLKNKDFCMKKFSIGLAIIKDNSLKFNYDRVNLTKWTDGTILKLEIDLTLHTLTYFIDETIILKKFIHAQLRSYRVYLAMELFHQEIEFLYDDL